VTTSVVTQSRFFRRPDACLGKVWCFDPAALLLVSCVGAPFRRKRACWLFSASVGCVRVFEFALPRFALSVWHYLSAFRSHSHLCKIFDYGNRRDDWLRDGRRSDIRRVVSA
jgi:hypothetical protein